MLNKFFDASSPWMSTPELNGRLQIIPVLSPLCLELDVFSGGRLLIYAEDNDCLQFSDLEVGGKLPADMGFLCFTSHGLEGGLLRVKHMCVDFTMQRRARFTSLGVLMRENFDFTLTILGDLEDVEAVFRRIAS